MNRLHQPRIIVMGVSAVGKSTVGTGIAESLAVPFLDADSFHTEAAVAKMSQGIPLDDLDREPWLRGCGRLLAAASDGGVLACSALARRYRRILSEEVPAAIFVHLSSDFARIAARAERRTGHFMPPSLLRSQLATLEPLGSDENGFSVAADQEPQDVVWEALNSLRKYVG